MKLGTKITLCSSIVLCFALALSNYLTMSISLRQAKTQAQTVALERYQLLKFALQSELLNSVQTAHWESTLQSVRLSMQSGTDKQDSFCAVFDQNHSPLFSDFPNGITPQLFELAKDPGTVVGEMREINGRICMTYLGWLEEREQGIYLSVGVYVDDSFAIVQQLLHTYQTVFLLVLGVEIILTLLLSKILLRPIRHLIDCALAIADGDYGRRVHMRSSGEIQVLADSFDHMSNIVQERIETIEDLIRQKEDFVSNFAHELKTPLTSIIGYADLLYQKELPRDVAKLSADYIRREGLRLESLSQKLMELTIYNRQEFPLTPQLVTELFLSIQETLMPMLQKHGVSLHLDICEGCVQAEPDLFKTMFLNLIDNSVKATATEITIRGRNHGETYTVEVIDNGMGIPEIELSSITEAFYMVDKSRARKQHGAGLGLALVQRISQIHGGELRFSSKVGQGTTATVVLQGGDKRV